MGVIAKKHKGAWWVFINHRGQRKAKRIGTKEAAREVKAKIQSRLSAGDLGILDKPGPTFAEAADRWLEGYVKPCLKPRSYEAYTLMTKRFLLPTLGNIPVRSLSRKQLKDFVADLHAKGLSPKYVNTIVATLSGILQQAVEDEYLDHNPATRLRRYTKRQDGDHSGSEKVKYWTGEQITRILERSQRDYPEWYDLLATMAWGGFRIGEAIGLQREDVDLEERAIYLKRSVSHRGSEVWQGTPKGNKGRRVEMADRLVHLLADRRSRLEAESSLAGRPSSKWVFPDTNGADRPVRYHPLHRVLTHILDLEHIPRYGRVMTHAFRHSWATWILQNAPTPGAILYVSRQLGHASVKMTLDVYSHLIPEENRHLSDLLANSTVGAATTRNPDATRDSLGTQAPDIKPSPVG